MLTAARTHFCERTLVTCKELVKSSGCSTYYVFNNDDSVRIGTLAFTRTNVSVISKDTIMILYLLLVFLFIMFFLHIIYESGEGQSS